MPWQPMTGARRIKRLIPAIMAPGPAPVKFRFVILAPIAV